VETGKEYDPEKCNAVFGKDHAPAKSMIPKSGNRFSEKIMLQQNMRDARWFNLKRTLASSPMGGEGGPPNEKPGYLPGFTLLRIRIDY
jgi:hypothetical protein